MTSYRDLQGPEFLVEEKQGTKTVVNAGAQTSSIRGLPKFPKGREASAYIWVP